MPYKYYMIHPDSNIKVIKLKNAEFNYLYLSWPKDKILSPIEKTFADYCKKWFSNLK